MAERKVIPREDVLERLRAAVFASGGVRRFARGQGVSESHLSNVLSGRKGMGDSVLRAIGLQAETQTIYVQREAAPSEDARS